MRGARKIRFHARSVWSATRKGPRKRAGAACQEPAAQPAHLSRWPGPGAGQPWRRPPWALAGAGVPPPQRDGPLFHGAHGRPCHRQPVRGCRCGARRPSTGPLLPPGESARGFRLGAVACSARPESAQAQASRAGACAAGWRLRKASEARSRSAASAGPPHNCKQVSWPAALTYTSPQARCRTTQAKWTSARRQSGRDTQGLLLRRLTRSVAARQQASVSVATGTGAEMVRALPASSHHARAPWGQPATALKRSSRAPQWRRGGEACTATSWSEWQRGRSAARAVATASGAGGGAGARNLRVIASACPAAGQNPRRHPACLSLRAFGNKAAQHAAAHEAPAHRSP